jgi:hypothetical protein
MIIIIRIKCDILHYYQRIRHELFSGNKSAVRLSLVGKALGVLQGLVGEPRLRERPTVMSC